MNSLEPNRRNRATSVEFSPWIWVPSLYFAEGIPYVVVMSLSVVLYKRLGVSNSEIALYTSWLYLPWIIKPLWSPLVDVLKTKRYWIWMTQLLIGAGFAGIALCIPVSDFFRSSLALFWLLAFSSATHDIAADGFYLLGLPLREQAWFVGIRSTAYRLAMISGQGVLIMFAGWIETRTGLPPVTVAVEAVGEALPVSGLSEPDWKIEGDPTAGRPEIAVSSSRLRITYQPADTRAMQDLLDAVRASNVERGFCRPQSTNTQVNQTKSPRRERFENWIRTRWGAAPRHSRHTQFTGSVGLLYLRLTQPLEGNRKMVLHVDRYRGSSSIQVVAGDRFEVTPENCDQTMITAIQLDPKLAEPAIADFRIRSGKVPLAWSLTFYVLAGLMLLLALYHRRVLPHPASDVAQARENVLREAFDSFASFFRQPKIVVILLFLLLYRFAEAQLAKLAAPFLLDSRDVGGLGLTTAGVGFVYGTVGVVMLTAGGILGGFAVARRGLKFWLPWMVAAINLPNLSYTVMAFYQPESLGWICTLVGLEQFGYGFGFTAYLLYCMLISQGRHETVHYAICTGLMAAGMMLPGMFSGWLQELLGYRNFFIWIVLATIPSFLVTMFIPLQADFGKKELGSDR